jgi:ABC-type transporter Mla subunit MlaD
MVEENLRQAAGEAMKAGEDVTRRFRDIALSALSNRRFDREGIRDVVRALTEGMAAAAPSGTGSMRKAMGQAFRGMDEALTRSVEAGEEALRKLAATGRSISENEVQEALAGLKKIEEDFLSTVNQVAESANERARPELRELASRAARAGTQTGRQAASLMADVTFSGIELAGHFSARFAQMASGVLAGMADALEKSAADKQTKRP